MIRRYYILPLRPDASDAKVQELLAVLRAADQLIPGLRDSSAGIDLDSRTVVWENTFVDEASYAGPYMVHPYHIGAIDNYVMADSPECLTQDIFTARYQLPDATQHLRRGIRRVLLLNLDSDAGASTIASLAARPEAMTASAFGADDIGWVSAKGRAWTHVWEQGFADLAQLHRFVRTPAGMASSSLEGLKRLGPGVQAVKVFTYPFELEAAERQAPPPPADDAPVSYTITARIAADDVDRYVGLLERLHDPFMDRCGSPLVHRSRTVAGGYLDAEVRSTWQLPSLAAYSDVRAATYADPLWNEFVRDAMPLVRGGTRRFHRDLRTAD